MKIGVAKMGCSGGCSGELFLRFLLLLVGFLVGLGPCRSKMEERAVWLRGTKAVQLIDLIMKIDYKHSLRGDISSFVV